MVRGLARFLMLRPVRYLILAAILAAVIYWQREPLGWWLSDLSRDVLQLFGWGLVLLVVALGTAVWLVWKRRLSSVARRWNRCLGGISLFFAAWGILSCLPGDGVLRNVNLGGSFGLGLVGDTYLSASLRIAALLVLGAVLVAPRTSLRVASVSTLWFGRRLRGLLSVRPTPRKRPPLPVSSEPRQPVRTEPVARMEPRTAPVRAESALELRQVAQEVWKKYGESPSLVTVDGWRLPPIDILEKSPEVEFSQADNMQRARLIEDALASYGVEAKVVQINAGPTVTQFGVEPGWDRRTKEVKERDRDGNVNVRQEEISKTRVKVERITSLGNDLALALAAPSIRIEAPVPGQSVVGVEVPNVVSSAVSLRGGIETNAFQKVEARSKMSLALGTGAGGEAVAADLARMPHLLIAGATGSGKTVCLNATICCLLMHNTPNDVRLILIDPKRVELTQFNSIPHLATKVIVDTNEALVTLRWLGQEMDTRYQKMAQAGARNIEGYNKDRQGEEKMPYLVLVIDELADLMMAGYDEVEHILCRLAQLARATGIHLVVATQRPSVDVVTGLIKANFPTRISFAVTSQVDSRTILDFGGAEKLLGRGDMLFMPTEAAKPKRLQGCFVSDAETERLVYFWGSQQKDAPAKLRIGELIRAEVAKQGSKGGISPDDPLLEAARQLAEEHEHISVSFLQRRLRIGYPRAARIMEQLQEEMGGEEVE
jgi:S-DNA-T family DNA segregation ATPase FtsK/SpoIIIE